MVPVVVAADGPATISLDLAAPMAAMAAAEEHRMVVLAVLAKGPPRKSLARTPVRFTLVEAEAAVVPAIRDMAPTQQAATAVAVMVVVIRTMRKMAQPTLAAVVAEEVLAAPRLVLAVPVLSSSVTLENNENGVEYDQ